MQETVDKINAVVKFKGTLQDHHNKEAIRLYNKISILKNLSLIEEMSLDSIIDMYNIKVEKEEPKEK